MSRLPHLQLLALAGTALLIAPGCSALKGGLNPEHLNEINDSKTVAILYRTESDRLNLAGGGASGVQQASYQGQPQSLLPPVSTSTLKIVYPHPEGRSDYARAYVAFSRVGEDADNEPSLWTKLTGFGAKPDQTPQPFEVWALDVPKYQIDGIITKLQEANFFRRSKVLNSETYLGVSMDGKGFGKDYRNVGELDALLVRVRQQGWPVGRNGKPLQQRRLLPPRQQQAGVYQARSEMPAPTYRSSPQHFGAANYPQQQAATFQPAQAQPRYDYPSQNPAGYQQTGQAGQSYPETNYEASFYGELGLQQSSDAHETHGQQEYDAPSTQGQAAMPEQQLPPGYPSGNTAQP